jgi:hypothetical protein
MNMPEPPAPLTFHETLHYYFEAGDELYEATPRVHASDAVVSSPGSLAIKSAFYFQTKERAAFQKDAVADWVGPFRFDSRCFRPAAFVGPRFAHTAVGPSPG